MQRTQISVVASVSCCTSVCVTHHQQALAGMQTPAAPSVRVCTRLSPPSTRRTTLGIPHTTSSNDGSFALLSAGFTPMHSLNPARDDARVAAPWSGSRRRRTLYRW